METNIHIDSMEIKVSKKGMQYKSYKTSEGSMSCFEENVCAELDKCIGKDVKIGFEQQGIFKNIKQFLGLSPGVIVETVQNEPKTQELGDKTLTMYVSYVKDIFNTMVSAGIEPTTDTMNKAIALVKQAKEGMK